MLKLVQTGDALATAKIVNALFDKHIDYQWDSKQEAQLRAEIYLTVRSVVGPEKMIKVTSTLLRLKRI